MVIYHNSQFYLIECTKELAESCVRIKMVISTGSKGSRYGQDGFGTGLES